MPRAAFLLLALAFCVCSVARGQPATFEFTAVDPGDWNDGANWTLVTGDPGPATFPNTAEYSALLAAGDITSLGTSITILDFEMSGGTLDLGTHEVLGGHDLGIEGTFDITGGELTIRSGGNLTVTNGDLVLNGGTIMITSGGALNSNVLFVESGATVGGTGAVNSTALEFFGRFTPGDTEFSIGDLHFPESPINLDGTLVLDLTGDSTSDRLVIDGGTSEVLDLLIGTNAVVELNLLPGFILPENEEDQHRYEFITLTNINDNAQFPDESATFRVGNVNQGIHDLGVYFFVVQFGDSIAAPGNRALFLVTVPEPGTWLLLALPLSWAVVRARRRRVPAAAAYEGRE